MSLLKIPAGWQQQLSQEVEQDYFNQLEQFLTEQTVQSKTLYPPQSQIFAALEATEYHKIKMVIIGQDPYHGPKQANGLAFSVNQGQKLPPSLRNIFKALEQDLAIPMSDNGDLSVWAKQGVLLLNTVLTVEQAKPHSHAGKGWEQFTDAIITSLNKSENRIVYLLWGNHAHKKESLIDNNKHSILKSVHPSPLSAHRGFFTCQHFSKANQILVQSGQAPIQWSSDL